MQPHEFETPARLRRLQADELAAAAPQLAALVVDAVADGASVGYLAGVTPAQAEADWRAAARRGDGRVVLVAEDAQGIAGMVALVPAAGAFQPHRADIAKMIVHRRARGRGLATALMQAAEHEAVALRRPVLSLMTRRGCDAERLYQRLGWVRAGVLPDDSLQPDGALCDAAIYVKRVAAPASV